MPYPLWCQRNSVVAERTKRVMLMKTHTAEGNSYFSAPSVLQCGSLHSGGVRAGVSGKHRFWQRYCMTA